MTEFFIHRGGAEAQRKNPFLFSASLCLRGAIFFFFCLIQWSGFPTAGAQKPGYEWTTDFPAGGTLTVHNLQGNVTVQGWDEDAIWITAERRGAAGSPPTVGEITVDRVHNRLSVTVTPLLIEGTIDVRIVVPKRTFTYARSESGDIRLMGVLIGSDARTDTGDISCDLPESQNAEVLLRSTTGTVRSGVRFFDPIKQTDQILQGRLNKGGENPFVLVSERGTISLATLPPTYQPPIRPRSAAASGWPVTPPPRETGKTTPKLGTGAGDPARPRPPADADAISFDTDLINLTVNVATKGGRTLTDLKAGDFSVYEDDVKQDIAHFAPVETPFNLVLLLDLSGSTGDKLDIIRETAGRFVDAIGPRDKVAVVTFTRKPKVISRLSNDRKFIKEQLRTEVRRTDDGTAFFDAMWFVLTDVLKDAGRQRNAIVVLTDGLDNSMSPRTPAPTRVTFRQMLDKVLESGVVVYPLYLDTENDPLQRLYGDPPDVYAKSRAQLRQLAEGSGGLLYQVSRLEDLGDAYNRVAAELRTLYSLGYYPVKRGPSGSWHKLLVKVGREDAVCRTRRGYFVP